MKIIISAILLALLASSEGGAMGIPTDQRQLISAEKAGAAAIGGYRSRAWAFPPEYARAMRGAKNGAPLLVERLDREDVFYYIVPFEKDGKAALLVMVDAGTGDFREAVPLPEPTNYPFLSAAAAKKRLAAYVEPDGTPGESDDLSPSLVWKPSEASQSPFEPLWRFKTRRGDRYVDQTGQVHPTLARPLFKGG